MTTRGGRSAHLGLCTLFRGGGVAGLADVGLLGRLVEGRGEAADAALAALVERHGPMVWRTCRAILRDEHEAEDAFQATFLVLVRRAGSVRDPDALGPWLHRVASRAACHARSAAERRMSAERRAAVPALIADREDRHALGPDLLGEVDRLPEHYRAPVVLCDLEGLSYEEAAGRLGCPVGTIRSRLARGRRRLRDRMERRGPMALAGPPSSGASRAIVPTGLAARTVRAASRRGMGEATIVDLARETLRGLSMTRIKAIAGLALSAGLAATCAAVSAQQGSAPRQVGESPRGGVEREILRLEQEWADAIVNRDRAVVDRIVADDVLLTDPAGRTWDRAEYLAEVGGKAFRIESYERDEVAVHVYAGAAVVSARVTIRTDATNAGGTGRYRTTNTYVRRGGGWRCVAAHESRLGEGPARPPSPALYYDRAIKYYRGLLPLRSSPEVDRARSDARPR